MREWGLRPTGWRASAGCGLAFGGPSALLVFHLGNLASNEFGALYLLFVVPWLVIALVLVAAAARVLLGLPIEVWWWLILAPAGTALVILVAAAFGGSYGDQFERSLGWALVTLVMYAAGGVCFGSRVPLRARVLALVVLVGAAPAMLGYDHAAQHRWRMAALASAPAVLPVAPGYRVAAVRADRALLSVELADAADARLRLLIMECGNCADPPQPDRRFVDGFWITAATPTGVWPDALAELRLRPASRAELARLPVAAPNYAD